ncbi:dTDP-glucose 4,6-dehydratase [Nocardia amikacinitolerans]|uniref:NAD-dependent epimerase/dehydratase family protein n=1 Tax=Nocardia amikacinitolerans TaxID=756689 RepID=UPI000835AD7B|nr:NAD-dependent epimerase/dehydratase family protein [Nocardia amikacinitolerans]MCP2317369.1 dTDP-glucose 4,6-dehydratase [Nocardia amikacinitolerans]
MNHVVVTGGAGFLGSHLCRALLERGDRVTAIDNLSTGRRAAVERLTAHPRFALRIADTAAAGSFTDLVGVTHIAHLARTGSPAATAGRPIETLRAASTGTLAALDEAARHGARIVVAVGLPDTPQAPHRSWPHIANGSQAAGFDAHDASEYVAEAAARHYRGANVGIVRLFEAYGPHLWPGDRVTATICAAALRDQTIQISEGDARSFVYVADAIEAIIAMLDSATFLPVDVGGPRPIDTTEFARTAVALAGSGWIEVVPAAAKYATAHPNLARTRTLLGWQPTTPLHDGLHHTLDWLRTILTPQPK